MAPYTDRMGVIGFSGESANTTMPISSKPLPNSLKIMTEPEQLELFSWSAPTIACRQICEEIADLACRSYHVRTDNWASLSNAIVHNCSGASSGGFFSTSSAGSYISEYINGAATALNPLPPSTVHIGTWHSDRAALSSDWQIVQQDMDQVWHTITSARDLIESAAHERSKQQERQRNTKVERTDAA
jgi:hypothetical protein